MIFSVLSAQIIEFTIVSKARTYKKTTHLNISRNSIEFTHFRDWKFIPCVSVEQIFDYNGQNVEFDCLKDKINFNVEVPANSPLKNETNSRITGKPFIMVGGFFIVMSGYRNYQMITEECNDCSINELNNFIEKQKSDSKTSAIFLMIGGTLIIIGTIIGD